MNANIKTPIPVNEPVRDYRQGSAERSSVKAAIESLQVQPVQVPLHIGGEDRQTDKRVDIHCPHDHDLILGTYSSATSSDAAAAVDAAQQAQRHWQALPWQERVAVFLRAADLAAGPWRDILNASTMLGQGKSVYQAEIDAACELVDFLRFNCYFAEQIYAQQPISSPGVWNRLEYRPLDGFVFAVTPFNFTAIAANLPTAPALMGNTVVWKPSERSVLSSHLVMRLLIEAGLPAGVVNFLPTDDPAPVGDAILSDENLAGVHFTGSTATFQAIWQKVSDNIARYRSYPRLVGETGGKDFVFAHPSADLAALATGLIRGAFEFQGQKCSAASRAYIPASMWDGLTADLKKQLADLPMGPPTDFRNFVGAVIDRRAFDKIASYIDFAADDPDHEILAGGECDDTKGFFIQPTIVVSRDSRSRLMTEEIFGPVLTLYRYEDESIETVLDDLDGASVYALTGAVFARDRIAIAHISDRLRHSAGNFYVNDKPTGAVVGQQPFGGGRKSGTNDKAGSALNLLRWCSARTIKETFASPTNYAYPFMEQE